MPPKEELSGNSVPSTSTSKPSSAAAVPESSAEDSAAAAALQKMFSVIETRFIEMDSKFEALSLSLVSKLQSPAEVKLRQGSIAAEDFESPAGIMDRERNKDQHVNHLAPYTLNLPKML